jgi:glycerol-3-phosphate dehydrogenase subunit B
MAEREADLIVVGAGLAGLAAAGFAAKSGLKTIVVGSTAGGVLFASGLLDLLGIHPSERGQWCEDPWGGIAALAQDCPEHPYARLGVDVIQTAWSEFLRLLGEAGLHYRGWPGRNAVLATSLGTLKITYRVPETMWPGVTCLQGGRPALIIDFEGMKDFSARQMVETLGSRWQGLRARRLDFPYAFRGVDRHTLAMAEALESPQVRAGLAAAVRPLLGDAEVVGMPAVLGRRRLKEVAADLERQIGVPVFEIPGLPPSVPGLRLKEALEGELQRGGVDLLLGRRAVEITTRGRRCVSVVVKGGTFRETLEARGVVLATGRFLGGGLVAGRKGIREPVLDLPVHQPGTRSEWHRRQFLDPRGHPVNRAGLVVDDLMRPLGLHGSCAYENLFAAGSVLAHQDWMRTKCGAGLAVATAYGAVASFLRTSAEARLSAAGVHRL